jgi:hypothetical protein
VAGRRTHKFEAYRPGIGRFSFWVGVETACALSRRFPAWEGHSALSFPKENAMIPDRLRNVVMDLGSAEIQTLENGGSGYIDASFREEDDGSYYEPYPISQDEAETLIRSGAKDRRSRFRTILVTDGAWRTAAILVIETEPDGRHHIHRHAAYRGVAYEMAWVVGPRGFGEPFWKSSGGGHPVYGAVERMLDALV